MNGDDGQSKFYGGAANFKTAGMPKAGAQKGAKKTKPPTGGKEDGDEEKEKPTTKDLMD